MSTILRHLLAAAVCVTLLAGIDSFLVTRQLWFRAVDGELFAHSWLLWAGFAGIALPFVAVIWAFVSKRTGETCEGTRLVGCIALWGFVLSAPVMLHQALDSYLEIGGSLEPLKAPMPWLKGLLNLAVGASAAVLFRALGRKAPIPMTGAVVVAGLGLGLAGMRGAPSSEAPDAATAPADAPNLMLLVWDTARAKSLALYGAEREVAPNLTALANEAIVFEEARSTSVFTLTSHLSMLTGTYPSHHGARLMRQFYDPTSTPTIAKLLRDAGYRTGGFVGTAVLRGQTGVGDGFEVYDDQVDPDVSFTKAWALVHDVQSVLAKLNPRFRGNGLPHWFQDFQTPADGVLDKALAWIDNGDPRPWFCFVNLYDVHWPYLPTDEAREKFVGPYDGPIDGYMFRANQYEKTPGGRNGAKLDAADDKHLTELYEGEFWDLDKKVDAFWDSVQVAAGTRGVGAMITADHGEAFGEGERYKHDDVLESQVRVPLILVPPGGPPPEGERRRGGKSSGVDVAPTLLSLAGIEQPPWMPGQDLSTTAPSDRRITLVEHRDHIALDWGRHAVYREHWKLVVHGSAADGKVELFDLRTDADGLVDVSAEQPEVVKELKQALDDMRSSWGADGDGGVMSGAPLSDHLKVLGYGG